MKKELLLNQEVNRDSPIPYYYQIVEILREVIRNMDVDSDVEEGLPSEAKLVEIYKVNRGTIRHALDVLEHEGLIYCKKGRGSFIRRPRLQIDLLHFNSTTEELRPRGHITSSLVKSMTLISPDLHIQKSLGLKEEDLVWQLVRLRSADGEPISLQWSDVPQELAPDLDQKDLTGSLFQILKTEYQREFTNGNQTIHARMATPEEAKDLQIRIGDPVFEISRTSFDQNNQPVEYMYSVWRADRYDIRVHLSSNGY
jgi:GntR family transcriptional regulator